MTEDEFWSATDQLTLIYRWARASYVAPWALLYAVLLRAVASTGPHVMLPGPPAPASLNMGVVLVGRSGAGKGVADKLSRVVWPADIHEEGLGSGQGVAELFREQKNPEDRITRAIFTVSEVDHLAALHSSQGNSTRAALKAALTGDRLGSKGASSATTRSVPADSYRLGLSISAQFGHTAVLMDDVSGGTPQRLLWASVTESNEVYADRAWRQVRRAVRTGTHLHSVAPLRKRLEGEFGRTRFEDLAVEFQCCAASIERAAEHWFASGPVVPAVLATRAVVRTGRPA